MFFSKASDREPVKSAHKRLHFGFDVQISQHQSLSACAFGIGIFFIFLYLYFFLHILNLNSVLWVPRLCHLEQRSKDDLVFLFYHALTAISKEGSAGCLI
jgi:hypothetical protein